MIHLVLAGLLRRRWQTLAALLGVAVGAGLLLSVLLLGHGLRAGLEVGRQRLGADLLIVPSRAVVDSDRALFAGSPLNVYMDSSIATRARGIPGVRRLEAQFFTQSLRMECCSVDEEIRLVGIEPGVVSRLAQFSKSGQLSLADDEVIVGARLLGGVGKRGSLIELLGGIFRVGFRLESTGTALDYSILMPIDRARALAGKSEALQGLWSEGKRPENLVSAVLIEVESPEKIDAVASELSRLSDVKVIKAGESFQRFKRLTDSFVVLLGIAALVTALGGLAYLTAHFASSAWDRKGEWALYRSLGASRGGLLGLVLGESLGVCAVGGLLGIGIGLLLYHLGYDLLARTNAFPFIPADGGFLAFAGSLVLLSYILVGLLASIGPGLRVAQLEPALVMAQGDID